MCDQLAAVIAAVLKVRPTREYTFAEPRKWRFDVALTEQMIAVEVDGGAFSGGHSRGPAYEKEAEKFNAATLAGWRVFRVTPKMVKDGRALQLVRAALAAKGG